MTGMTKAEALRAMDALRLASADGRLRDAARVAAAALRRSIKSTRAARRSAAAKRKNRMQKEA